MNQAPHVPASNRRPLWLAFGWGLAEATFFFIVPDVLLSRLALQRPRTAFLACFSCLAGALAGGLLFYGLGSDASTRAMLLDAADHLPGISQPTIEAARDGLAQHGLAALLLGIPGGIPYKLYALQAAPVGVLGFLAASIAARLARFVLATGATWLLGKLLLPRLGLAAILRLHAVIWAGFYVFYFWRFGL